MKSSTFGAMQSGQTPLRETACIEPVLGGPASPGTNPRRLGGWVGSEASDALTHPMAQLCIQDSPPTQSLPP